MLIDSIATIAKGALTNAELYRQVDYEKARLASITLNMGEGVCAVDAEGKPDFCESGSRGHGPAPPAWRPTRTATAGRPGEPRTSCMGPAAEPPLRTGLGGSSDPTPASAGATGSTVPVAYTASAGAATTGRRSARSSLSLTSPSARFRGGTGAACVPRCPDRTCQPPPLFGPPRASLSTARRARAKSHAVLFIDVDRFKIDQRQPRPTSR